jgi:predicted lipoprotein
MLTDLQIGLIAGGVAIFLVLAAAFGWYYHESQATIANLNQSVASEKAVISTDASTITQLQDDIKQAQTVTTQYTANVATAKTSASQVVKQIKTEVPTQTTAAYVNQQIQTLLTCSEIETGATAAKLGFTPTVYQNWVKQCAN